MNDFIEYCREVKERLESDPAFQLETIRFEYPADLLKFWQSLQAPVQLTPAQRKLGSIMRGEE